MKKHLRKSLSYFMTIVLLLSVIIVAPIQASALSVGDVVSWMSSKNGTTINDGGKTQCVAAFNSYLRLFGISDPVGMYPVSGAKDIFDYDAPSGWQKIWGSGNYQVGDVVIWDGSIGRGWGHVGMVYSTDNGVKIFDQNWVTKNVCGIHDLNSTGAIRGVFRPPLGANPFPGEEDTSWNVPVWVYANRWLETYDDWGNVESGRHIDEGDYCYVERVYRNGYVRVRYPSTASSDGYRWAYVQASGFSLSPKNCYADIGDKFYAVIKNAHYNNCVSRVDGTNQVYLQNSNGTSKQIWYFERQEDNAYVISSCLDGNVLEMTDGIRENITHITAHDSFWGGYYQQWYMVPCENGYRLLSKHYTSEMWYLDRSNNGDYNGNRVQIYEEASNEDQVWIIDKDSANADLGNNFFAAITNTQYGGYITKVNNTDNLYLQENNNTSKQIWLFDRQSDGAYTISSCYDSTLMEMTNGIRENRSQISAVGSFWGGYCQQWHLIPYANGYKLLCKHYTSEGWYLDRSVNSDSNGNFVQIYEKYWDTRDQVWTIEKRDHVHSEIIDNYIEASCTETGLTQGSHCSVCGIVITAQETIPCLGHDIEIIPEKPATETETGLTTGKKCKRCGEWIEQQMVIPMIIPQVKKGDLNCDTKVNMKDIVLLQQYLNNWDVTIDEKAANVNGDNKINMKDLVLLQQYLNNWDVELV